VWDMADTSERKEGGTGLPMCRWIIPCRGHCYQSNPPFGTPFCPVSFSCCFLVPPVPFWRIRHFPAHPGLQCPVTYCAAVCAAGPDDRPSACPATAGSVPQKSLSMIAAVSSATSQGLDRLAGHGRAGGHALAPD